MSEARTLPSVTIIMPVRNEETFIERSLGAVLAQDYPPEKLEVLIADGMSDDRTVDIIKAMPGADRVRIIPNPERIQSHGLNHAIPHATGDYVIRIDGHTIIQPDYVRQCIDTLIATSADNVGGAMDPVGTTAAGKAIAAAGKSSFAVPTAFHVSDRPQETDTVYLGAWPRRVFDDVGSFSTDVGVNEDYEFNYRIRVQGGTVYFNPAIKSVYYGRQTWRALARQYYRYGRSKIKMLRKHPESLRPRQIAAPLFVAGLIGGIPLAFLFPLLGWVYSGAVTLYLILSLIFALRAARQQPSLVPAIILVFGIMHITWGAGFWRELLLPGPL